MRSLSYATLEAVHAAWTDAAAEAEPGAVRLLFTRGMKAVRAEMALYLAERNQLALDYATRDEAGNTLPVFDGDAKVLPGRVAIGDALAYTAKLAELHAQSVDVELPLLTEDLLCRTSARAESLALLLDFLVEVTP